GLMIISRFSVVARWHVLLRSGGVKARWADSARITFAGLFASNFLPTTVGGDVARMGGALQMGFDAAVSAASLIVDRLVGLLGMVLTVPMGLSKLLQSGDLQGWESGILLMVAADKGWINKMLHRVDSLRRRLVTALKLWISQPGALGTSLLFSLVHMACLFGAMFILLEGMHEPLPYLTIAGLWSLVYVITLIPFTINAFGLQEVSITWAFAHLGGVSEPTSIVLALLVRTLFMLASVPGALFLSDVLPGVAKAQPLLTKLDQ
ncbi:MAG: lysylphosphatidylglycerol synthase transmembrane domain-containing protein, partial [Anaerolineales bacterium]